MRQLANGGVHLRLSVSIHAPVRMRLQEAAKAEAVQVSIHAPVRMRPRHGRSNATVVVSIHAPVRMRLYWVDDDIDGYVSIHAPVRMRQENRGVQIRMNCFNSRTREDATPQ